jgi:hypothetical protein
MPSFNVETAVTGGNGTRGKSARLPASQRGDGTMKSILLAAAMAVSAMPFASMPSHADALVITNDTDHDHDRYRHDHDADIHTGAIVVHKDEPRIDSGDCKTKTVTKSNLSGDKTVTKTKRTCD